MAGEAPDPKTFTSWTDAFQYPVPAVRRMEQQLRSDISGNKERLRTLVGASYRDLLGTADAIIEMDSQMQQVESYLAIMGVKCNARLLERSGVNILRLKKEEHVKDRAHYSAASQLSILAACPAVISRLLRRRGSFLLAAKVLVISRLLHKKISEDSAHLNKAVYLEGIRSKLAKLRQKLLNNVDMTLRTLDADQTTLVEVMCAFALATSSSARDVLRHFHHLRHEAIISRVHDRQASLGVESVLGAMKLWIRSIQDTHTIFPRQLSAALVRLKAAPILSGDDVRGIAEMDQDIHGGWIGEDVRNFTPYIRHDDLDSEAVRKLLAAWAPMTLGKYLDGVHVILEGMDDHREVILIRKRALDFLLSSHGHVNGVDKRQVVDSLRDAFKGRLLGIAQSRCSAVEAVTQSIRFTLEEWERDPPKASSDLWDKSLTSLDTSRGAPAFIDALSSRVHGTSSASKRIAQQYRDWLSGIQDLEATVEKMRATEWEEDDDEDLVADLEDEEDDDFDARHTMLSVTDPQELADGLQTLTREASSRMQLSLDEMVQNLHDPDSAPKAIFLLRLFRDSLNTPTDSSFPLPTLYCSPNSLTRLYDLLAAHVTQPSLRTCRPSVARFLAMKTLPQRALWEGNPELPVLPSPWTCRALQSLTREMGDLGVDVWTKGAVEKIKLVVRNELGALINGILEEEEKLGGRVPKEDDDEGENRSDKTEGERAAEIHGTALKDVNDPSLDARSPTQDNKEAKARKDRSIQLAFDVLYLLQATSLLPAKSQGHVPSRSGAEAVANERYPGEDALSSTYNSITSKLSLATEERKRMETGAAEYWKRTSLLFALLG